MKSTDLSKISYRLDARKTRESKLEDKRRQAIIDFKRDQDIDAAIVSGEGISSIA